MSPSISNSYLDYVYDWFKNSGAIGCKILGSGGGGFMLVFAKPEDHDFIEKDIQVLVTWKPVSFQFEFEGSKVIYNANSEQI